MLGDLPSIVPRRNYDIRTQCLKGTCSSSELPGRWHVPVLDDACPCRGCSSMFSPEASTWKGRLRVPLLDQIHCFGFPDRADDGVRTSRKRDGWPPSRIDRIRTCDPMLPKHVRYQTAPQSDIFDRTPWLTSYVRALLNAISSDSGTVLSSTTMLSS